MNGSHVISAFLLSALSGAFFITGLAVLKGGKDV